MARMLIVALVALTPQLVLAGDVYCVVEGYNVSTAGWDAKKGGEGTRSPTSSPTYVAPEMCQPVRPREEAMRARERGWATGD